MKLCAVFLLTVFCEFDVAFAQTPLNLHNGLTEKIGNFSIELLYHTSLLQGKKNFILSPVTVWTVLALTAEAADGQTLRQINNAIRLKRRNLADTRKEFGIISQYLVANTSDVDLAYMIALFVDESLLPERNFVKTAKTFYKTQMIALNFQNSIAVANTVNAAISALTRGKIPKLIDSSTLADVSMILTSALYFKGAWTMPFNISGTLRQPFFSSDGNNIGEVNMMYQRHTFPIANIEDLEGSVLELAYGAENRLSMLVMLPYKGVSLERMFFNFNNVTLDTVFEELKISREEYDEDQVDCYLPRFKIESDIDMTPVLRERFGIEDLFDPVKAKLPAVAQEHTYVSKVVHKAQIEVTEEGTTAAAVTEAEYANRFGIIKFEANRPFAYMIVERVTNSIVFGGIYQEPSLY